jgi:hypothetical protein
MKIAKILLSLSWITFVPYSWAFPGPDGNPDRQPYAGQPGSVYDPAANPPRQIGTVAYNPDAPAPGDPALQIPPVNPLPPPRAN